MWYPIGWDDNGLPTERRVQNYFGVRCDPTCPTSRASSPGARRPRQGTGAAAISRPNFMELCTVLTAEDERSFEDLFQDLGLSVDWRQLYATIGDRARRTSQRGFLRLLARGEAYAAEAPTLWDVDFRTAVARRSSVTARARGLPCPRLPPGPDGTDLEIETTRPELLPACVAVVVHPSDARYGRSGRHAKSRRPCSARRYRWSLTSWPNRRRARACHGVHLRRHDRRDLVARAATCPPEPSSAVTGAYCWRSHRRLNVGGPAALTTPIELAGRTSAAQVGSWNYSAVG